MHSKSSKEIFFNENLYFIKKINIFAHMSIRKKTLAELQAESRLRQQRLREQELKKKKEQREKDSKRKKEMRQCLAQLELQEKIKKERLQDKELRTLSDETSKWIDTRDDYYTLEELMNPPEGEPGRLSDYYWELINKFRKSYGKTETIKSNIQPSK